MASGIAIGGFAQGLSQGLQSGFGIGKARREAEKFALEKPKLELEADVAQREQAASRQFDEEFRAYNDQLSTLPDDQRPSDVEQRINMMSLSMKSRVQNGLLDPEKLSKMGRYGQELEQQGMLKAAQLALAGDTEGAMKAWNSTGQKAPQGTVLEPIVDPETGRATDVGIFVPGKGGKMQQTGTINQALLFMSADKAATFFTEMEKERQATKRTAMNVGGNMAVENLRQDRLDTRTDKTIAADLEKAKVTSGNRGGVTDQDRYRAFNETFDTLAKSMTQSLVDPRLAGNVAQALSQAKAASRDYINAAAAEGKPLSQEAAVERAIRVSFEENGLIKKAKTPIKK